MLALLAFLDRARRNVDIKTAVRQPDRDRLANPSAGSRDECLPLLRHFRLPLNWWNRSFCLFMKAAAARPLTPADGGVRCEALLMARGADQIDGVLIHEGARRRITFAACSVGFTGTF